MHRPTRLKLADLNPLFTCLLCGGYFVDATTIIECLHSFCRACIVRYLDTSKFCPVCDVQVHKTKPLLSIRSDNTLQNIVYKLVPGLYQNEMKRRREFYADHLEEAARCSSEERGVETNQRFIYSADESISLSLEYATENVEAICKESALEEVNGSNDGSTNLLSQKRYLRCPAAVTIGHLKKFITMKYDLPAVYTVEISYSHDVLSDDYTLMDIAYIYSWKRCGPMCFSYKITERSAKRQKISHTMENSKNCSPEESVSKSVNSHPQLLETQTIVETVPEISGSIKSTKLTTKLRKLSSKKIKKSRRRKKHISSIKKLRIVPLSSKTSSTLQDSSDQSVSALVASNHCVAISCADNSSVETVVETHHTSDISTGSVNDSSTALTSNAENCLPNSIQSSTSVPVVNSICSSSSCNQNSSVNTDILSTSHSFGSSATVSACDSSVSNLSATSASSKSLSASSSSSCPTSASCAASMVANSVVNTHVALTECSSDRSVAESFSRPTTNFTGHLIPIVSTATNGTSVSVVTSIDNPVSAVSIASPSQNCVASSNESSVMSSLPLTSVMSTNTPAVATTTSAPQVLNSAAGFARFSSNPAKPTPIPIVKSTVECVPSSATKSIQNATVSSNPPLRFTLSSHYSMKPAVNNIPASVRPTPPQSVMLISSTRPTLAPIPAPSVSSVPGLIVCPTTSIAVCSAPNVAVISSKPPAFPVVPQAVVRSKRGRPPGRRGKNSHLRGGKKFSPRVANGLPLNPLECSSVISDGVSQHTAAFTMHSPPISLASYQVPSSVPAVVVSSPLPSTQNHSFEASETLVVRSSASPLPASSQSSTVTCSSVTGNTLNGSTSMVSSVGAPVADNVPILPIDPCVTSNVATSPTANEVESVSVQSLCNVKESALASEEPCINSENQSETKLEKSEDISPCNQKEVIPLKETSHVTVTTKSSPKKEENITLKITVKKSLYQSDFSDNDDLGCQPDLVVDEEKMDNSDDEADEALHEKIRAIAEKEDEAEATDDADSGRASDISSQARSTCDDDIGSPLPTTRTPDVESSASTHPPCSPHPPSSVASLPLPISIPSQITSTSRDSSRAAKPNGIAHIISNLHRYHEPKKDNVGALDLSVSHRKPEQEPQSRPRQRPVANPPVLDLKHRLPTCLSAPTKQHTSPSPKNSSVPSAHRNTATASSPSHHRTMPPSICSSPSTTSHPNMAPVASASHYSVVPTTSAFPYTTMASSSHRSTSSHRHSSSSHRNTVQQPTNHIPAADTSSLRNLLTTPVPSSSAYKLGPPSIPIYKKTDSYKNHRFKGTNLTVINPDPNGYRQKIVIKNLDPRPSNHSHHHHRL